VDNDRCYFSWSRGIASAGRNIEYWLKKHWELSDPNTLNSGNLNRRREDLREADEDQFGKGLENRLIASHVLSNSEAMDIIQGRAKRTSVLPTVILLTCIRSRSRITGRRLMVGLR
jgi:hypothetical protein